MQAGGGAGATCWDHLQPATIIITDYTLPAALAALGKSGASSQYKTFILSYNWRRTDKTRGSALHCLSGLWSDIISTPALPLLQ